MVSGKRKGKALSREFRSAALRSQSTVAAAALGGQPADWRVWLPLSIVVLVLSCGLLFFRLGHYPLWCDEADTALYARGIAHRRHLRLDRSQFICDSRRQGHDKSARPV